MKRNWPSTAAFPASATRDYSRRRWLGHRTGRLTAIDPDAADLAAAYAFGLRKHPFLDGNKRTAFVVMELFLNLNGWTLDADDAEYITTMESLAAGGLSAKALASWLRARIARE